MDLWLLILSSLYFFLPAYLANMTPVLTKKVPFLAGSVNERIFGSHKTWRGLVFASLVGLMVFAVQKYAYNNGFVKLALIDYNGFSIWFGLALGMGAILGDLVKSYFKRKMGIAPGGSWIPWDQLDFVFGALLLGMIFYVPPAEVVLFLLILSPILHLLFNYLGYLLKINEKLF